MRKTRFLSAFVFTVFMVLSMGNASAQDFLISNTPDNQVDVDVAWSTAAGEFLTVWANDTGMGSAVYGRRVNSSGTVIGSDVLVSAGTTSYERFPALAGDGTGYLVVWIDQGPNSDVWAQRLASNATKLGSAFLIEAVVQYTNREPDVAYSNGSDVYLVVWEDQPVSDYNVYGQLVDASTGTLVGSRITIATGTGNQREPRITYNSGLDEFFVIYKDTGGAQSIYGQRVDAATGTLTGGAVLVRGSGSPTHQAVTFGDGTDDYLVVWRDASSGSADVYGQLVTELGAVSGGVIQVAALGTRDEWYPDVAYSVPNDRFKVVFQDKDDTATYWDLSGQWVASNGALDGPRFSISTGANHQEEPSVAFGAPANKLLTAWSDWRNNATSLTDVYGEMEDEGVGDIPTLSEWGLIVLLLLLLTAASIVIRRRQRVSAN